MLSSLCVMDRSFGVLMEVTSISATKLKITQSKVCHSLADTSLYAYFTRYIYIEVSSVSTTKLTVPKSKGPMRGQAINDS